MLFYPEKNAQWKPLARQRKAARRESFVFTLGAQVA